MSNSSNDVKSSSKPVFSYARAAQGTSTPASTAQSPQLNGNAGSVANDTIDHAAEPLRTNGQVSDDQLKEAANTVNDQAAKTSASDAVHMPPRNLPATATNSNAVQFGNFADEANTAAQASPMPQQGIVAASGGTAPPPALRGKDVPQFGSVPASLADTVSPAVDNSRSLPNSMQKMPSHSRSNSNTSEFRPPTMSPNPSYPMGFSAVVPGQYGQYSPAMPNNYRGRGMGMNQFQGRGGARNMQGNRNTPQSPLNSPQQSHGMSAMGSPGMYQNYMGHPQMYANYGGFQQQYGYNPNAAYQQQSMGQNYMNSPANRAQMGYQQPNQYQNPHLQAPTTSSMSRSGSAASERPSGMSGATPTPSSSTPVFTPPRKKGSSAIRIVDPNSKNEVVLPKPPVKVTPDIKREAAPSPAPKSESPALSAPARPPSSSSVPVVESSEQRKAKQDAAKQAILDRIAAAKASEQSELDKKAAEEKAARDEQAAKAQAEKDAQEAEEKARVEAAAAKAEEEKARAAKLQQEKEAAEQEAKAAEEARIAEEAAIEAEKEREAEEAKANAAAVEVEEESKRPKEVSETAADTETQAPQTTSKTHESSALDTIVEPVSAGQSEDYIETKAVDREEGELSASEDGADVEASKAASQKEPALKASAMTTALKTSRRIASLSDIVYPSGINAPSKDINKNAKEGRFKYDKEFLLQFRKVFTDKPTFDWDDVIKMAMRDGDSKSGKGGMGGRSGSNRAAANPFGLPAFNSKPLKSSDERFMQAEKMRAAGIDPASALAGSPSFERGSNFKPSVARKDSANMSSGRAESKKGGKAGRITSNRPEKAQVGAPTIAPEDVKPLANSGNRWTPKRATEAEPLPGAEVSTMAPDIVQRKVKGLLNKLTLDNFDRITDQILEIASQSKEETDGRTLRQVIALTFEKATDEAHFSNMYARFCRKMMECTSEEVKDEGITDKHGKQVVGGTLFRKYLLSRCQEDFERGWKTDLPPKPDGEPQNEEAAMLSDEYYIAAAAKRRGLGLVRFVGELFLLHMLNEKIMQECIRKLLANVTDPEEEEVESLSKLVETVGSALDSTERGREVMNVYMTRMAQLTQCDSLSSRIKFMVLDVLDLRRAGWVGGKADKGPKTIQQIHDEAAAAALLKEAQRGPSHRGGMGGGGRPDFGRGDVRNMSRRQESHGVTLTTGADGWSTLKQNARDTRAGDLTKFGKFGDKRTSSQQSSFGPGGNLSQANRTSSNLASRNPSHNALSREDSRSAQAPSNPFAALEGNNGEPVEAQEETPAADATGSGRPRLNLLPKGATDGTEAVNEPRDEAGGAGAAGQTQASEDADVIPMPGDE